MRLSPWIVLPAAIAGAVVLLGRRASIRETVDWEDAPRPGRLIDVDGYRVHVVERGAGPALLMVHGFGGSTVSYGPLIELFADRYRCVAVDLKGFGLSERRADSGHSHTDQAMMLAGLMEELGMSEAVVIGHSMGGGVVQRLAAAYPERVRALVLAASVVGDEQSGHGNKRAVAGLLTVLRPAMPVLVGMGARRILEASFHDRTRLTREVREAYERPLRIRGSRESLAAMLRDLTSDAPIDTSRITMPVLVLNAAEDRVVPLSAGQRLRERLPQARLVVIERAGHLLLEERPGACADAIEEFLEASAAVAGAGEPVRYP